MSLSFSPATRTDETTFSFYLIFSRWETYKPVSFQSWKNSEFGNKVQPRCVTIDRNPPYKACELVDVKANATSMLHPSVSPKANCTLLLLTDLGRPQWVTVDCNQPLFYDVVCFNRSSENLLQNFKQEGKGMCPDKAIIFNKECILLTWFNGPMAKQKGTHPKFNTQFKEMIPVKISALKDFYFLIEATNVDKLTLLFEEPVTKPVNTYLQAVHFEILC